MQTTYLPSDIIILSFQPYAYEKIKSGSKKIEYRTRFRKRQTIAVIYVSSPIKEMRGFMLMDKPVIASPADIAKIAEQHIPGNGASVYEYLKDKKQAYAIPITSYREIEAISLEELRAKHGFTAPQSYTGLGFYPQLEKQLIKAIQELEPCIKIDQPMINDLF